MDRIGERAKCPFFLSTVRGRRIVGVECESLDVHLGFKTSHFVRVKSWEDLTDYTDIFCCDMYKTCAYYKAVMHAKYGEG